MEAMRQGWTDERLDDLNRRVDTGFSRIDADIRELRTDMNARFDSLQRTMLQTSGLVVAALIGVIATQL
jgi:hypothetical protein